MFSFGRGIIGNTWEVMTKWMREIWLVVRSKNGWKKVRYSAWKRTLGEEKYVQQKFENMYRADIQRGVGGKKRGLLSMWYWISITFYMWSAECVTVGKVMLSSPS